MGSDTMVNVRVTLDAFTMPLWLTSLQLCETEAEAVEADHACYWPPRI